MTAWSAWFRSHLQSSADGFVWAFSRVEPDRHEKAPPEPRYLGT